MPLALETDLGQLCDQAARTAAERYGVPPQIMLAITRVETGTDHAGKVQPWPWTVNLRGEGHWFPDLASALAFATPEMTAGTTNMDIGCFQLNLRWHAHAFRSLDEMFDPEANARYAAAFLTDLHAETGNWVDAVAAYHSRTPEHAAAYVTKIETVLTGLEPIAPSLADGPAAPRENRFPLLLPGSGGALASLVPASGGRGPLIGGNP